MDLSVQGTQLSHLNCIMNDIIYQEELSETIIPDSYPDILSIIDSYAEPMVRSKECREGSVLISGGIRGGLLYMPEDHSAIRCLDFYLPFTIKFEHRALTEHSQPICEVQIKSVDGNAIHSRKALLRVNLGCQLWAFEEVVDTIFDVIDKPDCLQLKQSSYEMMLPVETSEKTIMVHDLLELPMDQPPILEVCKIRNEVLLQDQTLTGDKVVFKGDVRCKLLYLGEDYQYHVFYKLFPFSQFCELHQAYDAGNADLVPALSNCNWELQEEEEHRSMQVSLQIRVQCVVSENKKIDLSEDAYCIGGTLTPVWNSYTFQTQLDQQSYQQPLHKEWKVCCQELLDSDFYFGFPSREIRPDQAVLTLSVQSHGLGRSDTDTLVGFCEKTEIQKDISAAQDCQISAKVHLEEPRDIKLLADRISLASTLTMTIKYTVLQSLSGLSGGSIALNEKGKKQAPALILRKMPAGTSLWTIAKQYGTSTDTIQSANQLDQQTLHTAQLLIIPII